MLKLIVDGEKFEALLNSLREAKARHIDPEAEDGGRLAAINALDAALQFIRSLPGVEEERLHIPLTSLSGALLDYTDGRNPRLFDRSTSGRGARPQPLEWDALKAGAAVAMECYYRAIGLQPDAATASARDYATKKTARELKRRGWKSRKGADIRGETVARWRDECANSDR